MVYVLDQEGKPMMPTTRYGWVRRSLKTGKAKVVRREPFTIQLTYDPDTDVRQETTLGMDIGYEKVGVSVVSKDKELFSGEFKLRTDIQKKLETKSMYRRIRRSRLRHRRARFLNRRCQDLMPSVKHKLDSHLRILNLLSKVLPIGKIILEIANFDTQKIQNPEIKGKEYQEGSQKDFQNVKEYVKTRDRFKCYFDKTCSKTLHVHHIKFKSRGGSDNPKNLITLCDKHHKQLHEGKIKLPENFRHKPLRAATFMNTVSKRLKETLPEAKLTYGYLTKQKRYQLELEKSHANDAFVIAGGENQDRCKISNWGFKRKNNRELGKQKRGFAPSSRKCRYKIQPKDILLYEGKMYESKGMSCKGRYVRVVYEKIKDIPANKCKMVYSRKTIYSLKKSDNNYGYKTR